MVLFLARRFGAAFGQQEQIVARVQAIMVRENFKSPIPHPRHLGEYELIGPVAANRIISMAEKAQNTNINLDNKALDPEIQDEKRGMWMGFGPLIPFVISATHLLCARQRRNGGPLPFSGSIRSYRVFVNGRLNKPKDE